MEKEKPSQSKKVITLNLKLLLMIDEHMVAFKPVLHSGDGPGVRWGKGDIDMSPQKSLRFYAF